MGLRLVERRESEDEARLLALREAASVGLSDMETGRFLDFDSPAALSGHLANLTAEVLVDRSINNITK